MLCDPVVNMVSGEPIDVVHLYIELLAHKGLEVVE
jgi:hypothetical protein